MIDFDHLIQETEELQPLPASAVRLATAIDFNRSDLEEICDIIAYDQALTFSLLRAVNSAADRGANEVALVHEAVFRLGEARVLALAISASARGLLMRDVPAYGLGEGELWRHSVAAAAAAETIMRFAAEPLPPEFFTAALLHDIGKLMMGRFLDPFDLEMIHRAQVEGGLDPLAAESQILYMHHGELGGIIAQHWQLPEKIVKGIIYHHTPADGLDPVCDAVYAANLLAKRIENGSGAANPDAEVLERLGLPMAEFEEAEKSAREHFDVLSARYNAA